MKYLIDASVSWFDLDWVIRGINLNILISIAIHKNNQFVLDNAIIELVNKVVNTIREIGLFMLFIKTWWGEAPNKKLEALVYHIRFN